ncbi:MAG: excinuclease ABC subunit UvrC, partial [Candidatus Delongbacteria bacterium]|nr:excinuclease ABC subunit UvrC [Candidatus Delongbacteria bacterium]MCG2760795.1 excinuclease ABC subunit UvrC [Candidatus Delongbacteria bacterium]
MSERIEHILENLPASSGVYFFKNKTGKIIYIGKAKNLRSRVKSYFLNIGKHQQFKTEVLVKRIETIEYIVTDNELEALLLEANLIKQHKPKYNIDLKDDKSYPYVKITKELFPQIFITRNVEQDGSKYLGPFIHVRAIRGIIATLKKLLKIRNCSLNITSESIINKKHKVCLDYQIKICGGYCVNETQAVEYKENVKNIIAFFSGQNNSLTDLLEQKMKVASKERNFELATEFRNALKNIDEFTVRQKVENAVTTPRDYFAVEIEDNDACCVVFKLRNGRLIARNHFFLKGVYQKTEEEVLEEFIKLYYDISRFDIPNEIVLNTDIIDYSVIEQWLRILSGQKVNILTASIGDKAKLLFLAQKNAQLLLNDLKLEKMKRDFTPNSLKSLMRDLDLKNIPNIIECFDISHFAGKETVASMVTFKNAKAFKSGYRKFKIRTVEGVDDFASMREVIERRYTSLKEEEEPVWPDLIMVDGGKGQLSSAVEILEKLNMSNIPIIGLAKRLEEVFVPDKSEAVIIPRTSSALKLLQQVRDESHRFAITYHQTLRGKSISSELENIKGIGPAKRKELFN